MLENCRGEERGLEDRFGEPGRFMSEVRFGEDGRFDNEVRRSPELDGITVITVALWVSREEFTVSCELAGC
jgi:hypothetical protein